VNAARPTGPLGQPRGIGFGILIFIVTFGIYGYYWTYMTFEELKNHRGGQGIGGAIALILMFVGGAIAIPFIAGSELGNMYAEDGQEKPVTGLTGLWILLSDRRRDRLVREGSAGLEPLLAQQGRRRRRGGAGTSDLGGSDVRNA